MGLQIYHLIFFQTPLVQENLHRYQPIDCVTTPWSYTVTLLNFGFTMAFRPIFLLRDTPFVIMSALCAIKDNIFLL